jgi:hypothetical protein
MVRGEQPPSEEILSSELLGEIGGIGIMEYWSTGVLEYWSGGITKCQITNYNDRNPKSTIRNHPHSITPGVWVNCPHRLYRLEFL